MCLFGVFLGESDAFLEGFWVEMCVPLCDLRWGGEVFLGWDGAGFPGMNAMPFFVKIKASVVIVLSRYASFACALLADKAPGN